MKIEWREIKPNQYVDKTWRYGNRRNPKTTIELFADEIHGDEYSALLEYRQPWMEHNASICKTFETLRGAKAYAERVYPKLLKLMEVL